MDYEVSPRGVVIEFMGSKTWRRAELAKLTTSDLTLLNNNGVYLMLCDVNLYVRSTSKNYCWFRLDLHVKDVDSTDRRGDAQAEHKLIYDYRAKARCYRSRDSSTFAISMFRNGVLQHHPRGATRAAHTPAGPLQSPDVHALEEVLRIPGASCKHYIVTTSDTDLAHIVTPALHDDGVDWSFTSHTGVTSSEAHSSCLRRTLAAATTPYRGTPHASGGVQG